MDRDQLKATAEPERTAQAVLEADAAPGVQMVREWAHDLLKAALVPSAQSGGHL
jgi:hypothetical protein